jgi:phosphate transport system protein
MHRELEKIRRQILALGALVEDRVRMATRALDNSDVATAQTVIKLDWEIDELEVEVEEECLKILALHQPVAVDLRFLITAIKITNDLERVGDLAVNIAHNVRTMARYASQNLEFDYSRMAEKAENMVRMSLDALVNLDADMARLVVEMDDEVDQIQRQAYDRIKARLRQAPERAGYFINLLLVSRHLERLADHATNIAEEIIHLIDGAIIRHRKRCACP